MSIKTYQNGGGWLLFLILSIGLHAALVGLSLSPGALKKITPELLKKAQTQHKNPFYIDVITLPPDAIGKFKAPEKLLRLADRSISVDEESSPLPLYGKGPTLNGNPAASTSVTTNTRRGTDGKQGTRATGGGNKKSPTNTKTKTKTKKTAPLLKKKGAIIIENWEGATDTAKQGTGEGIGKKGSTGTAGVPSLFPSDRTIARVARKNNTGRRSGIYTQARSKKLQINATELKDARYLLDLKRKLDLYWNYPISAAKRGEQGKLRATFKVNRDGTIHDIKLVKSSGYPTLDDAVITALRLCSPLNPLPDSYERKELNVKANFEYILTRVQ